jgi:hypothetical protein
MINRLTAFLLSLGLLSSCQSAFTQFYEDYSGPVKDLIVPPSAVPRILSGDENTDDLIARMWTDGYVLIGASSFNGVQEDRAGAIEQALKVGAEIVALNVSYESTERGSVPITTQQAVTTTSSGTASTYGSGGAAYGRYFGTTTTMVPTTTYVPYAVDRFDQVALYFAPVKPACLGIFQKELSNEERQLIGSNKGVRVFAVRRGSPAYLADILPGDIILNSDDVFSIRRGVTSEARVQRRERSLLISVTGGEGCPA